MEQAWYFDTKKRAKAFVKYRKAKGLVEPSISKRYNPTTKKNYYSVFD